MGRVTTEYFSGAGDQESSMKVKYKPQLTKLKKKKNVFFVTLLVTPIPLMFYID